MESMNLEYKKTFGKEVIISLVAFANTDGGKVIIGIDDAGTISGVEVGPETLQRYLNEIKVSTYPQLLPKVFIEDHDGKRIEEMGDFFKAELRLNAPPITPPISDDVQSHATGLETRILQILGQNPRISTGGIAGILEMRPDTVKEYLARMKAKELIAREGSPRSGIWRVLDRSSRENQS